MAFLNYTQVNSPRFNVLIRKQLMKLLIQGDRRYDYWLSWSAEQRLQERIGEIEKETLDLIYATKHQELTVMFWDKLSEEQHTELLTHPTVVHVYVHHKRDNLTPELVHQILSTCPPITKDNGAINYMVNTLGWETVLAQYGHRPDIMNYQMQHTDIEKLSPARFLEIVTTAVKYKVRLRYDYADKVLHLIRDGKLKVHILKTVRED